MTDLQRDLEAQLIAAAVAAAPPLTPEQFDELRGLAAEARRATQAGGEVVDLPATEPSAPARAA